MDQIWDLFQIYTQANVASSSQPYQQKKYSSSEPSTSCGPTPPALSNAGLTASAPATLSTHVKQINEHVHEISNLLGKRPSLELIFFHGLEFEDSQQPHLNTWLSRDRSQLWLSWLFKSFPDARILTVSYDAHEERTGTSGRNDMYVTSENLLYDLISDSQIGQIGCPVVLVGHCLGGLVMKQLCVHANSRLDPTSPRFTTPIKNFLKNIKGLFFYATPHLGTTLADMDTSFTKGSLFQDVTTLNTEVTRRNEEFCKLRKNYEWKTFGLGENHPITRGEFEGILVAEASARYDMDEFYTIDANHTNVCRPESAHSSSFKKLLGFLLNIEEEAKVEIHECQGLPEYPLELESRAQDVQKQLVEGGVLGISGMGGIGKTTLARKLFNVMSKDFEYTCFLENAEGKDVGSLKEALLGEFQHKGRRPERDLAQWSELKDKKTLLVIDDVDSEDQLKILPQLKHFKIGSCLIMTGRNREIFKIYQSCIVYEVQLLEIHQAEQLFCQHAFGLDPIPNNLIEHVTNILRKCDGLPLTLEVMGRYLRGRREVRVWEEIINDLDTATPINGNDRVWQILKVSYDHGLSEKEKGIFLDAAMMFHGELLVDALKAWGNAKKAWENLVDRSLVKQISKTRFGFKYLEEEVWVHEHLRDLAKSIAHNDMVLHARGPEVKPIVSKLNTNEVTTVTKSLQLWYDSEPTARPTLTLDSLLRLQCLETLVLGNVDIKGTRFPWSLWSSPLKMDNLLFLRLSNCEIPQVFVEVLGNLTNLHSLTLTNLDLGFRGVRKDFGNLSQLKFLKLENLRFRISDPLISLESFGNLPSLERLHLRQFDCLELPESLWYLSSVQILSIEDCARLARLPESFGRNLTPLEMLSISECPLKCLPRNFSKLARLERLWIVNCERLEELGDSFGDLVSLKNVYLAAVGVQKLPESFGNLSSLERFSILSPWLESLSEGFSNLTALKKLFICSVKLKALPENFGHLSSLEECKLCCPMLETWFDDFGHLISLNENIRSDALGTLPNNVDFLKSLQKLCLKGLKCKRLPDSLGHMTSLRELRLKRCTVLESVPDSLGKASSLQSRLLQRRESDDLMRLAGECLETDAMEGVQLIVDACPKLTVSVLGSLGWELLVSEPPSAGRRFKKHTRVVHNGVTCAACEMFPLEGSRYKSFTKSDYDLCHECFQKSGSHASEYICTNHPEFVDELSEEFNNDGLEFLSEDDALLF